MKKALLFTLVLLLGTITANAAFVTYDSTPPSVGGTTNWSTVLTLPQFDIDFYANEWGPATLNSVTVTLTSGVSGIIEMESRDSQASTATGTLSAQVTMVGAGVNLLAAPSVTKIASFTAYDGVVDFAGTSGITFDDLAGSDSVSVTIPGNGAIAPFIGVGTIDFSVAAIGASSGSGPGNLVLGFTTIADAVAVITYDYQVAVPEPMTMSLLGLGGLALLRRRN